MIDGNALSAMARLRILLRTLEADLGMGDLSQIELDALAATVDLHKTHDFFKASDVAGHSLLARSSRASRYRVIESLKKRGLLKQISVEGKKRLTLELSPG